MTNEEKVARLEGMAAEKDFAAEHAKSAVFGGGTWVAEFYADAALLREAAQFMREREAASAKYSEWVGRALDKQKEYLEQCQVLIAERDAAMAEIERLREHEARARWCEERKAQVSWSITDQTWRVLWYSEACELRQTSHADRNAAIDAARGKV
jgi:hypothetical protein